MGRRRHRVRLPEGSFSARIDDLGHDGRGIARLDGKAVFIHGALPGESVEFRYTGRHSQYDEGRVERVVEASPDRVEPYCAHFGVCGGCSLQHLAAERQIAYKQDWLLSNLARIGRVEPETILAPLTGPHWGYRHKARLGVKYVTAKGRMLVGFRERDKPFVADLRCCEVLHPRVGGLLEDLAELIGGLSIARRLPQIEVAVGDTDMALCFRVLDPPDETDLARLIDFGRTRDIRISLQPGGPDSVHPLWPESAALGYRLPAFDLELRFLPHHFIQVNNTLNRAMVERAVALLDPQTDERVLDLFCGLGNFTLPLARHAARVVGVEGDAGLVEWAKDNARHNGIDNAEFRVADLAREFTAQDWYGGGFDKLLLDPPRSGAQEAIPAMADLRPQRIVYVSCHPATLARDAGLLVHEYGYRLSRAGVMDLFPHTAHVESIAVFEQGR
jgi:23S rRNA (uracil1939-C5)-methyltransferase